MAAAAVCLARGIAADAVRDGPRDVRRRRAPARGGRHASTASLYVNDSKATNVASAIVGIESFARRRAR